MIGANTPSQAALTKVMGLMQGVGIKVAQPEQIASVIAFLASNASSNVNGVILAADGGWAAA